MIQVDHYSDVLCVWAYIAQGRVDELQSRFADDITVRWHYLPVFGNVPGKMTSDWDARGGNAGYADHVRDIVDGFDHVELNEAAWRVVVPNSSAQAHLWLCAARLAAKAGSAPEDAEATCAWAFRVAFFRDARDISTVTELRAVAEEAGLPVTDLQHHLDDGTAHAALCDDMQLARDRNVRASPTLMFNEDRQRLTGNVGYRIIEANVRELLERPQSQHSWC